MLPSNYKQIDITVTLSSISDSQYTLVKKIGDGGFSSIYHVYDRNRKSWAVKIVNLLKSDGYTDKDLMNEVNLLTVTPRLSSYLS